ncbi:hypothetical protein BUE80_DR001496 [Diplocarpon rosae]|nr:hypothetical protein BUE80_DR001496 [Diplocarpon rosae]
MTSNSLLRSSARPNLYVCARCRFRASKLPNSTAKRWIGTKYLAKMSNAEEEWKQKASRVWAGKEKSMLTILEERGLVQTITGDRDKLDSYMTNTRVGAYVGIDPTAASLHLGHLLPLMSIFWMYVHGYHAVSLLGGATSKIGDPTDRLTTRTREISSVRTANMARMHYQLRKLWQNVEAYARKYEFQKEWAWHRELVNNNAWWNKLPMLEVLQILGPGMRLGSMLARDTVKNKMSKGDGMSYAEFSYPLMQAWDWWYMFHTKGIHMQIGGSDQYGNITAGIDAIKYITSHHPDPTVRKEAKDIGEPMGFTVPLLTTASGQKFGKSAGNAIWLDLEEMSSYDLYGHLLRTSDADVPKYLKMFTFMPLEKIDVLVTEHMHSPSQRKAQHTLARELIELVHGREEAKAAETQHILINSPDYVPFHAAQNPNMAVEGEQVTLNKKPESTLELPRSFIYKKHIGNILQAVGLVQSRSEGQRLINSGGAYVSGPPGDKKEAMNDGHVSWHKIHNWLPEETQKYLIHDDLLMFRKSKHNVKIVKVVSDDEYALSSQAYPGMDPMWRHEVLEAMLLKHSITDAEKKAIDKILAEGELFQAKEKINPAIEKANSSTSA